MGGAFSNCCLNASENTKNNRVFSPFEVIGGETCSESESSTTTNESIQADEDLTPDENFADSQRGRKLMRWDSETEIIVSQQDIRLSRQEMPIDTGIRDSILENLFR
mmetsp:Transcript_481/g.1067  ORF Transcript_481/g.1067 Transcript_481/m.1067 type:complete len:107 (+) Transcript_481:108-428(+)|eukprot:CAMPEP_0201874384 /NCGR_PEP_ID=MMETSP0902-20130614/6657_1 /ASSEMBLY_ACC=CAM_ASM_000551 /TAXON_ID=420261 /ORGANISM="Thalassiosira antarctica, Strain CCMP982" /LENGTH=106 /DNA_ID=CAMNT_0048401243 /DNA_START=61 /DNA_END=381 /DNA_ORIENTATION=-